MIPAVLADIRVGAWLRLRAGVARWHISYFMPAQAYGRHASGHTRAIPSRS